MDKNNLVDQLVDVKRRGDQGKERARQSVCGETVWADHRPIYRTLDLVRYHLLKHVWFVSFVESRGLIGLRAGSEPNPQLYGLRLMCII